MMALKAERIELQANAKAEREDAVAFSKSIIAEQNRMVAIIEPEEERLGALRDAWDEARKAEREAKIAAERRRVAEIQARIDQIRQVLQVSRAGLQRLLDERRKHEAEQQLLAEQRAELERHRERIAAEELEARKKREAEDLAAAAELDAELAKLRSQQAENERIAKEQQAAARAEQERIAAENQRAQAQREREDAERGERQRVEDEQRREENDARETALKAERDALDVQRREIETLLRRSSMTPWIAPSEPGELVQVHAATPAPVLVDLEVANSQAAAFVDRISEVEPPAAEFTPTADELIYVVSEYYGVGLDMADKWLRDSFGTVA